MNAFWQLSKDSSWVQSFTHTVFIIQKYLNAVIWTKSVLPSLNKNLLGI